ncbi:hypothetical protein CEXT_55841 [Caerostris extrusa]|uniref:Uncharacterized protein n=1 Tax=Caerostris extrusa TaxID=172846 RepID=A0AAV4VGH7_CAEEX|nr:hypothetical protein CEXT_55841 [Caerostris extrusa]
MAVEWGELIVLIWRVQPVALCSQLISEVQCRVKGFHQTIKITCNGCRLEKINSQLVSDVQCEVKGFRQTIKITSVMAAEWGRFNSQLVSDVQCEVKGFRQTIKITSVMAAEWGDLIDNRVLYVVQSTGLLNELRRFMLVFKSYCSINRYRICPPKSSK